jgi:hypothetical protein
MEVIAARLVKKCDYKTLGVIVWEYMRNLLDAQWLDCHEWFIQVATPAEQVYCGLKALGVEV